MTIKWLAAGISCLFLFGSCSNRPTLFRIPLYPGEIPNSKKTANKEWYKYEGDLQIIHQVSQPSLTVFLPPQEKATGIAVVICPGGGYSILAASHEGMDVARRFVESGIAAIVLKYRIPDDTTMVNKEIGPIQDAQRAMLVVRSRAVEWGIDPGKIGIMGFSAGGHLASTAGTHFQKDFIDNPGHISLRPDFMMLIYPVITFIGPSAHQGSLTNLLGPNPDPHKLEAYSNERQVTDQTPPTFMVHAKDDTGVPYANTMMFADSLRAHHVPVEVYLYDHGGHGFGMNNTTSSQQWMDLCIDWINALPFKS